MSVTVSTPMHTARMVIGRLRVLGVFGLMLGMGCGDAAGDGATSSAPADGGAGGSMTGGGGTGAGGATAGTGTGGLGAAGGQGGASGLGPAFCPSPGDAPNGVGVNIGQQLGSFVVKSCDGEDFSLDELCGAQGLWIFAAHGWCPICQAVSDGQEGLHDQYADQGLVTISVVVETASYEAPDADYCAAWRDEFEQEDVITLYDPTGTFLDLWPGGSSSLHAFVDGDRIIRNKLQYTSNQATIAGEIESVLGQ